MKFNMFIRNFYFSLEIVSTNNWGHSNITSICYRIKYIWHAWKTDSRFSRSRYKVWFDYKQPKDDLILIRYYCHYILKGERGHQNSRNKKNTIPNTNFINKNNYTKSHLFKIDYSTNNVCLRSKFWEERRQ